MEFLLKLQCTRKTGWTICFKLPLFSGVVPLYGMQLWWCHQIPGLLCHPLGLDYHPESDHKMWLYGVWIHLIWKPSVTLSINIFNFTTCIFRQWMLFDLCFVSLFNVIFEGYNQINQTLISYFVLDQCIQWMNNYCLLLT